MHSTCISWARISPQMSKVFVKLKKSTNTETAMLSSPNWNFTFCHWGHRLPVKALALSTPNIPYQNQITHICRFNEICGQNPKTPVIPEFSLIQSWIFYFTNYTSWCTTYSEYAKCHNNSGWYTNPNCLDVNILAAPSHSHHDYDLIFWCKISHENSSWKYLTK